MGDRLRHRGQGHRRGRGRLRRGVRGGGAGQGVGARGHVRQGRAVHEGRLLPQGRAEGRDGQWNGKDGITFPDGNTWAKLESTNLDTKAYPSKAERSTDLGKGGWSVDRLTKRMGGFY